MKPRNSDEKWTKQNETELKQLTKKNEDTDVIAKKLGRTKSAIYSKASKLNISLKPKDKS